MTTKVLVYLDTAHLAWLEHALLTGTPADVRDFLDGWNAAGCKLALSYHHVEEIAQLGSDRTRMQRLMTLWEFRRPVYYSGIESSAIVQLEIGQQLRSLAGLGGSPAARDIASWLFPPSTPERIEADVAAALPRLRRNRGLRTVSAWAGTKWKEFRDFARERGVTFPMSGRSRFTVEAAEHLVANIEKLNVPPALQIVPDVIERIRHAAAEGYSQRRATEHLFALDGTLASKVAPKADLAELGIFMHHARNVALQLDAKAEPGSKPTRPLVGQLDPYACPGTRLRLARLRAQISTRTSDLPSDLVDADHLLYAPYVDLMFVDKRSLEYLRQETRREKGRLLPPDSIDRIRQVASLDDIARNVGRHR